MQKIMELLGRGNQDDDNQQVASPTDYIENAQKTRERAQVRNAVVAGAVVLPVLETASGAVTGPLCFSTTVGKGALMGLASGGVSGGCLALSVLCCFFGGPAIRSIRQRIISGNTSSYGQLSLTDDADPEAAATASKSMEV